MNVIVIGGGYAGLSCLVQLRRQNKQLGLHLVDPAEAHCKLTHLHQTLHQPLEKIRVPFRTLAERFDFRHHRAAPVFSAEDLEKWQESGLLCLDGERIPFDYLVVATGAKNRPLPGASRVFDEGDFLRRDGGDILEEFLENSEPDGRQATVVGAGSTGIQFLFELRDALAARRQSCSLRLLSLEPRLLSEFPEAFHVHVEKRLAAAGIEYLPATRYLGQEGRDLLLENSASGKPFQLSSDLTLLFPGVEPSPASLEADRFGRVMVNDYPLDNVFAAGDCCRFLSSGLNSLTAQAALRKGMLVAENILRHAEGRPLKTYAFRERGYFLSLGRGDGVGWLGLRANLVRGAAAYIMKESLELQYDLFLGGTNTYFDQLSLI